MDGALAKEQGPPPERSSASAVTVIASAGACFALTCWVWSKAGRLGPEAPFVIARTFHALIYVLFAWGCIFGITFGVYLAICTDEMIDLLRASLLTSLPAVWFVPGVLLAATNRPIAVAGGLLVIANSARLIVSYRPPQRYESAPPRRRSQVPASLFGSAGAQMGASPGETFPAILGAFAFQIGIYAACTGNALLSAALFAGGAAGWTRSSLSRGASTPRPAGSFQDSLTGVLLVVVFAIIVSVPQLGNEVGGNPYDANPAGLVESTRQVFAHLVHSGEPKLPVKAPRATQIFSAKDEPTVVGKDGVPGVILRPKTGQRRRPAMVLPAVNTALSFSGSMRIPFTGEYHLFASSGRFPPNSVVQTGSPRDAVYGTLNGGEMQMEAYQPFDPPVDFAQFGGLRLTLLVGDALPAGVTLQLVTATRLEDLGTEFYGLDTTPEQTLDFRVPAGRTRCG